MSPPQEPAPDQDYIPLIEFQGRTKLSERHLRRYEGEGLLKIRPWSDGGPAIGAAGAMRFLRDVFDPAVSSGAVWPPPLPRLNPEKEEEFVRHGGGALLASDVLGGFKYDRLARVWDQLLELAAPSLRLCASSDAARSRTKLGGLPDLAAGYDWPTFEATPLSFVGQLDLGEISARLHTDLLPDHGLLLFFYNAVDQAWGSEPTDRWSWAVLHVDGETRRPDGFPDGLDDAGRFRELRLAARAEITLPPVESLYIEGMQLSQDEATAYFALLGDLDDAHGGHRQTINRVLGHPDPIQGDMQGECQLAANGVRATADAYRSEHGQALLAGADVWRLLLQIDSEDSATGMMWGDVGRLYYWMREQDLRERQWENCWMVLQCG